MKLGQVQETWGGGCKLESPCPEQSGQLVDAGGGQGAVGTGLWAEWPIILSPLPREARTLDYNVNYPDL